MPGPCFGQVRTLASNDGGRRLNHWVGGPYNRIAMKPDKYRKRFHVPKADTRLRGQIAREAARRLVTARGAEAALRDVTEADYYAAKRRAAAVLGHTVRPGDLPSDGEVREQVVALSRDGEPEASEPDDDPAALPHISEHLDRFAIYRMRLLPLEQVKQDPRRHPEGDALYHSLQVFERARDIRPYDEEFLLAALLHDVGKAIDPRDHVPRALESLRGTLTERSAWLIQHQHDAPERSGRPLSAAQRQELSDSGHAEDLRLLRDLDEAGRVPGVPVGTVEEALAYLRGLEGESYLTDAPGAE